MNTSLFQLEASWRKLLAEEFAKDYMVELEAFLIAESARGIEIYPRRDEYFRALNSTRADQVKVVILGQDPYHGPGQAHGLSFSVPDDVKLPPSLKNIYKEIATDMGLDLMSFTRGNLASWAEQGVLLLNSSLTVSAGQPGSHQGKGWERFTDRIIEIVAALNQPCVFILWGSYAQKKGALIDRSQHQVLTAPHPSPLSAYRGFFGCKHFSKCNEILIQRDVTPIDWRT